MRGVEIKSIVVWCVFETVAQIFMAISKGSTLCSHNEINLVWFGVTLSVKYTDAF